MRSLRVAARTVLVLLAMSFLVLSLQSAFADPQQGVTIVKQFTMETGDPNVPVTYILPGASSDVTAWWGIVAQAHSGTKGLWCAGTGGALPNYVGSKTAGMADFAIPDTSAYYVSDFTYWYKFPSRTSYPETPFYKLGWVASPLDPKVAPWTAVPALGDPLPLAANWTQVTVNRTGGTADLSSAAGTAKFTFNDWAGGGSAAGVTIDDVQVAGYLFGPVRTLTAARSVGSSSTVDLAWDAPYRFANNTTVDTRAINYRVWRKDVGTGVYTELAAVPSSAGHITATDASAPVDAALEYDVQAYNGSSVTDWGELRKSSTVPIAIPHFDTANTSPTNVGYGGQSTVSARFADYTGPLGGLASGMQVQCSYDGGATWNPAGGVTEGAAGVYTGTGTSFVNSTYRLFDTVTGMGSAPTLVRANMYLTTPGTPSSVKRNKVFYVTGKVSRVPVATRTVTLYAYQVVGKKLVLRAKTTYKAGAGINSIASYKVKMKLTRKATYKIRAVVSDAYNNPFTTGYRTFKAK